MQKSGITIVCGLASPGDKTDHQSHASQPFPQQVHGSSAKAGFMPLSSIHTGWPSFQTGIFATA
jgi:hypothetical protein